MLTEPEFDQVQQKFVSAWHRGDFAGAFSEINEVLRAGTNEMKSVALFFRGMMWDSRGVTSSAEKDWLAALRHASPGTFLRYELEHSLGKACEVSGRMPEALQWYRRALVTCSEGAEFSGDSTLTALLRVGDGEIPMGDREVVASVILKSWRVLQLSGKADLADIGSSIKQLTKGFARLVDDIVKQ